MENDFLKDLEFLGVTARLKRLSDALSASIKEYYRANEIDIEPSWHLVLLFLKDGPASLKQIADALHLSQPATTKMVQRMIARGYLDAVRHKADRREKNIRLSAKASRRLPKFERVWAAGQAAVRGILVSNCAFLANLEAFENEIGAQSFAQRAGALLERE